MSTNTMIYHGKTAVVTGSRGIAEAVVKNLHSKGAHVIIVTPSESSEKLADSLESPSILTKSTSHATEKIKEFLHTGSTSQHNTSQLNNQAVPIRCDLSSQASATTLVKDILNAVHSFEGNTHGKIDFLILCGGTMPIKPLGEIDEQLWNHTFAVNVVGPMFLTKEIAPSMANDGKILFFSTSLTIASGVQPGQLTYNATKGAIEQIARTLSKEPSLVSQGISTTIISPGAVDTELLSNASDRSALKTLESMNPYGRLGKADDIANVVDAVLLAGKWLNGSNIRANGGSFV